MTTAVATTDAQARSLERSYERCAHIVRDCARNFYYGLRLTPEPKRSALYAIYAWMRAGDDYADAPLPEQRRRDDLRAFTERTSRALSGDIDAVTAEDAQHLFWPAFVDAVHRFSIARDDIDAMLAGLREDLDHPGYADQAALHAYCSKVASSVGRVCVAIWGLKASASLEEANELASLRGLAFQRTNILRDYAEDFDTDRVYLPEDAFRAHGMSPADLRSWADPERCRAMVMQEVDATRDLYERSRPLDGMVHPDGAAALWAMTRIYRELLERVSAEPRLIASPAPVRISRTRKASIALTAALKARAARMGVDVRFQ